MNEIPPELFEQLMDGRQNWSKHGYLLVARSMLQIDEALDDYNAYRQALADFDEVFNGQD
jgi:hypothetical protein